MEYANGGEVSCAAAWLSGCLVPKVGSEVEGRGRLSGGQLVRPPLLEEGIAIFTYRWGDLSEVSGLLRLTASGWDTH